MSTITTEAAEALVGKVGTVTNPVKGVQWDGDYKIVGYHIEAEDCGNVVRFLRAESVKTLPEMPGPDTSVIRERPAVTVHRLAVEWFTPNED